MISAVIAQGRVRLCAYTGSFTAEPLIEFHEKLIHDTDGPVAEDTNGALKLFTLPDYFHNSTLTNDSGGTSNPTESSL